MTGTSNIDIFGHELVKFFEQVRIFETERQQLRPGGIRIPDLVTASTRRNPLEPRNINGFRGLCFGGIV